MTKLWKPRDVMIDIETLATRNDAAVIQIGAATFDEKSTFLVSVDPRFYAEGNAGADDYCVDEKTVKWWDEQSEEAKEALKINVVSCIGEALEELRKWLKSTGFVSSYRRGSRAVWANGVQFDMSILRYAYSIEEGHNNRCPWHYRQERDLRTLYGVFNKLEIPKVNTDDLVKHRADHDCVRQIRWTKAILDTIHEDRS